jgi:hypothetical protein
MRGRTSEAARFSLLQAGNFIDDGRSSCEHAPRNCRLSATGVARAGGEAVPDPTAEDRPLIAALRRELAACAAASETVTYRDLAARVDFPGPHAIHRLTALLEVLVREDHAAGRPLLAVLAVSRAQKGVPGRGFFQLLAELGRYDGPDQGPAASAHHARELAAALEWWGKAG